MRDEGTHQYVETEIGVRYTGRDDDGHLCLFIEPHSELASAEGRAAMYQRKGDKAAEVVTRKLTTRVSAWTRHPARAALKEQP